MPRALEGKLLLSSTVLLALGLAFLCLEGKLDPATGGRVGFVLGGAYWSVHLLQRWRLTQADPLLLPLAAWMNVLGLIFLYELDPVLATRQVGWIVAGLAALAALVLAPGYHAVVEYKYVGAVLALLLLAATLVVGARAGGAKSWLEIGFLRFQPVEAVKLLMVVFLAGYLDEQQELLRVNWRQWGFLSLPAPQAMLPLLSLWGLSLLLVAFQRDLGAALLLFATLVLMLYLSTGRPFYLVAGSILLALGFAAGYYLFAHVRERVQVWLDPWSVANGAGYQIIQGLFSFAAGGLLGTGLGRGQAAYVPAVATDYLFIALAEEMGLAGALAFISLYVLFAWRGFRIALEAPDSVGQLLAGGLTVLFALQSLVILGGVTKALPLTGVTLPFFSYGGSSMVVSYLLLGLLQKVSCRRAAPVAAGV